MASEVLPIAIITLSAVSQPALILPDILVSHAWLNTAEWLLGMSL